MKILHILDHSFPIETGYSIRTRYIMEFQKKLGLSPAGITSPKHISSNQRFEEIDHIIYYRTQISPNVYTKLASSIPYLKEGLLMNTLKRHILKIAQNNSFQVIHAHSPILCGLPAYKIAKHLQIPFIYEVRGLWEDSAVAKGKWSEKSIKYQLSKALETQLLKKTDTITTICNSIKERIIERGIDGNKIYVIPNGVDSSKFIPLPKDKNLILKYQLSDYLVIGFIGTLHRYEGVEYLVKAMNLILEKHKKTKLLIIGDGEDKDRLQQLTQTSGLISNVIFTGRIPHTQILNHYSIMDILVYPRVNQRVTSFVTPLKPLEAMSMAKSIIGSDVGGLKELILNEQTGLLFKAEDVNDLADKCLGLLLNENRRKELGLRARDDIVKNRNWATIVKKYLEIYQKRVREYGK